MNKTRRIILISAKSNINEQITGLRLGAVAYITKPFDPLYLKAMVQSQLYNMATLRKGFPNKKSLASISLKEENKKPGFPVLLLISIYFIKSFKVLLAASLIAS